jgi:hypothetical protein
MHYSSVVHLLFASFVLVMTGCEDAAEKKTASSERKSEPISEALVETVNEQTEVSTDKTEQVNPVYDYIKLRQKITYGNATAFDVKQALTEQDTGALTNTAHALYSMRWSRPVIHMLEDMWNLEQKNYPEFAWKQISQVPVRIALASTINRIKIHDTQEYKEYIRAHKNDEHEFHRAQVAISLGLNQDPIDVPYLEDLGDGDNHYVAQSAITALALMNNNQARKSMISLWEKYKDNSRGDLLLKVLHKAYKWAPEEQQSIE